MMEEKGEEDGGGGVRWRGRKGWMRRRERMVKEEKGQK